MTARSRLLHQIPWRAIISIIVLMLSVGFLAYKAYTSWDTLKEYGWQIRYVYLIPSFLLFVIQLLVVSWGWQSIMNHLAQPLPFREHLRIYAYTNLMRRIPAGLVWLIAGRVYAYRERRISARLTAIGSFLEYVLAVLTGLPVAALACSAFGVVPLEAGIALAAVTLILTLIVIHPVTMGRLLSLARQETLPSALSYRTTLTWSLIYGLLWPIMGVGLWLIACMFVPAPVAQIPITIGAMVLSSLISFVTLLSPSGLGVKELSLTILLGAFLAEPLPLLVALATRAVWTVYDVLLGALAWMSRPRSGRQGLASPTSPNGDHDEKQAGRSREKPRITQTG
jgi:hypothetical protein